MWAPRIASPRVGKARRRSGHVSDLGLLNPFGNLFCTKRAEYGSASNLRPHEGNIIGLTGAWLSVAPRRLSAWDRKERGADAVESQPKAPHPSSEAFLVRAQVHLVGPSGAGLTIDLPIGLGDCVWHEQPFLASLLDKARLGAEQSPAFDPAVDHDMRDVNALRPEFARHALGDDAQTCLGGGEWAKPGLPRKLADAPVKIKVPRPSGAKPRAELRPTRKPPKQLRRQNSFERLSAELAEINAPIVADIVNDQVRPFQLAASAIARSNKRATSRSQVASVSTGSAWPPTKTIARAAASILIAVCPATKT